MTIETLRPTNAPAPPASGAPLPPVIISLTGPRQPGPGNRTNGQSQEAGSPFQARLTVRDHELAVEVAETTQHALVGKTLAAAAYAAGYEATWEGPHIVLAVAPPICFGKVQVSIADEARRRQALDAACQAAISVLRSAGYQPF